MEPKIIVHGGAGRWSLVFQVAGERGLDITEDAVIGGVRRAAVEGYRVLSAGGSAIDAVVEAIAVMEGSGLFNAGVSSALAANGEILMDAGLMDGARGKAIGLFCLKYPKHPVRLARLLMDKTSHVLLGCRYADELARSYGLERHPGPHPRALAMHEWARGKQREGAVEGERELLEKLEVIGDTVGAVAVDTHGNIAAGVSTGGTNYKVPGRVGDSPIPGSGYYALNGVGGVAATGLGEAILVSNLASRVIRYLEEGSDPYTAGWRALDDLFRLTGGGAGLIILDGRGRHASVFNTEAMPWAVAFKGSVETGLWSS